MVLTKAFVQQDAGSLPAANEYYRNDSDTRRDVHQAGAEFADKKQDSNGKSSCRSRGLARTRRYVLGCRHLNGTTLGA